MATAKQALCYCLSVAQLDNYTTWIREGVVLNKLGAFCVSGKMRASAARKTSLATAASFAHLPHPVLLDRQPLRLGKEGQRRDVGAHQADAEHEQRRLLPAAR